MKEQTGLKTAYNERNRRIITGVAAIFMVIFCIAGLFVSDGQQKLLRDGDIFSVGEEAAVLLADLAKGENGRYGLTFRSDRVDSEKE